VFFDYGDKNNQDLLHAHGFVLLRNPSDYFKITVYREGASCPPEGTRVGRGCQFKVFPGVFNSKLLNYLSVTKLHRGKASLTHVPALKKYREEIFDEILLGKGLSFRESMQKRANSEGRK
jgi:hypothetical protein